MYIIMGGTGHVGSSVAESLLSRGAAVTIVTRGATHAQAWQAKGAALAQADVGDPGKLREAFRLGRRAFLLNPPASTTSDTDTVERASVANILAALSDSKLDKVVAESAYGAQAGDRLGDLSVLWGLEEGLRRQAIPAAIIRAAYYMSNWDSLLDTVTRTGVLPTMFPADLAIPMVSPSDLGKAAADLLVAAVDVVGVHYVEGPRRYSANDVAAAFSGTLGRRIVVEVTPRDQWAVAYRALGFSAAAARSYARMTAISVDGGYDLPERPVRGDTTLEQYIAQLVARSRD
jgi:uncharacterized protein YbjT (DUF2867 family)